MSDILHIHILGDRKKGESYIGFARKKLVEIISLDRPQKEIRLENGVVIFLQHTPGTRQDIVITVPERDERKKRREVVSDKEEAILFFYGPPKEQLALTNIKGLLAGGSVRCGDGHGTITNVVGNNLLGEFIKCWEPGDSVLVVSTGATAEIINCYAKVYHFTYTSYSLFSDFLFRDGWLTRSPADFITRMCRDNLNNEYRTHSKTYGNPNIGWMTLTAVESKPYAEYGLKMVEWVLCAKYNGRQVMFDGEQSSESFSRGFVGEIPLLFDLWEMDGTFHASRAGTQLQTWVFSRSDMNFVSESRGFSFELPNPCVITAGSDTIPAGLERETMWFAWIETCSGYTTTSYLFVYTVTGQSVIKQEDEEVHPNSILSTLWNPFKNTLFVRYQKKLEDIEPKRPLVLPECCYISLYVVGQWYSCMWSCTGSLKDCYCWVCGEESNWTKACPLAESRTIDCSYTVGGNTYTWEMSVVDATWMGTSVDYFFHTHHRIMFVPAPSTSRLPEIIIRPFGGPGGGASFYGGTLITGTAAEYSKFRDGQRYDWTDHLDGYCEDPIDPNPEYCEGELKTYSFTKWVFTADDKGFYLEYLTTRNTCNGPIEGSSYLGDKDYAPGASDWPHDHQWTAILMKGTEDIDGQLLTPTLVYVDGETDNNLFYGQKNGVTQISEEGNRAFFQYASREYFKEMIYGSD